MASVGIVGSIVLLASCSHGQVGSLFGKKRNTAAEDASANSQLAGMNAKKQSANTPTGYIYREFTIRQLNLGGRWDDPTFTANFGFQHNYKYGSAENYQESLKQGLIDDELTKSVFASHYAKMKETCVEHAKPTGQLHVRAYQKDPQWTVLTEKAPPYTQTRELYYQCLAEGDRE